MNGDTTNLGLVVILLVSLVALVPMWRLAWQQKRASTLVAPLLTTVGLLIGASFVDHGHQKVLENYSFNAPMEIHILPVVTQEQLEKNRQTEADLAKVEDSKRVETKTNEAVTNLQEFRKRMGLLQPPKE